MKPLAHLPVGNKDIWIFGYGSLVHTPNFQFSARVTGYITGYRRVFWQGSTDHRGTPQHPGRTVTLTADPDPAASTWGVAYQLAGTRDEQLATLSYLEWREKQYDVRELVDVYGQDGTVAISGALVYIASPANSNYLGPADLSQIAVQIATSRGPSGPNCDYLFKLADTMRAIGVQDPDLYGLEEMVRQEMTRLQAAGRAAVEEALLSGDADRSAETKPAIAGGDGWGVCGVDDGHEFRRWHQVGSGQQQQQDQREGAEPTPALTPRPAGRELQPLGPELQHQGEATCAGRYSGRQAREDLEDGAASSWPGQEGVMECGGSSRGTRFGSVYVMEAVCGRGEVAGQGPG